MASGSHATLPAIEGMKNVLFGLALIVLPGMGIGQTTSIDYTYFTMKADSSWQKIELSGIDSFVGGISNGIDTISFDLGRKKYITGVRFFRVWFRGLQRDIKVRPTFIRGRVGMVETDRSDEKMYTTFHFVRLFKKYSLSLAIYYRTNWVGFWYVTTH